MDWGLSLLTPHSPEFPLRAHLILPDPIIYYLAVGIDLILRLTWSLKLSPHLHTVHEIQGGIFTLQLLEALRRWMWVFFRVEWEVVKHSPHSVHSIDVELQSPRKSDSVIA